MRRLLLFCASAALLLGSAAPPESWEGDEAGAAIPVTVALPAPPAPIVPAPPPPLAAVEPPPPVAVEAPPRPKPRPVRTSPEPRSGAVTVVVSLPQQKAYVFRGRELIATSRVSTGKRGHETPAGTFRILQKRVEHYSNRYDNAPMPYMQRLTNYGIALHGGRVPGYPASHGCIRLPHGFAQRLYNLTDHGGKVVITRSSPRSASHALRLI